MEQPDMPVKRHKKLVGAILAAVVLTTVAVGQLTNGGNSLQIEVSGSEDQAAMCSQSGGSWQGTYCQMPDSGTTNNHYNMDPAQGCTQAGGTWQDNYCKMPNSGNTNNNYNMDPAQGCSQAGGTWQDNYCKMPNTGGNTGGGMDASQGCSQAGGTWQDNYCKMPNTGGNYGAMTEASCKTQGGTWKTSTNTGYAGGSGGWCEWANNYDPSKYGTGTNGAMNEASCKTQGGAWKTQNGGGWCEWGSTYSDPKAETNCKNKGGKWKAAATSTGTGWCELPQNYEETDHSNQKCYGVMGPCVDEKYDDKNKDKSWQDKPYDYENCDPSSGQPCEMNDHQEMKLDAKEMGKQKKEIERMLKDHERNKKDFDRLVKRIDQVDKELKKRMERAEKIKSKKGGSEFVDGAVASIKENLQTVSFIKGEVSRVLSSYDKDLAAVKSALGSVATDQVNGGDMSKVWSANQLVERYWSLRDALEMPFNFIEMQGELNDLTFEMAKLEMEAEQSGQDLPGGLSDLAGEIDSLRDFAPKALELYNEISVASEAVAAASSEDREYALQDLRAMQQDLNYFREDAQEDWNQWRESEPWRLIEEGYMEQGEMTRQQDDKNELENIRETLNMVEKLTSTIKTTDLKVNKAVETLNKLRLSASPIVDAISSAFEGEQFEKAEKLWSKLDDMGGVAEESMMVLMNYCSKNSKQCAGIDFGMMMGGDNDNEDFGSDYKPGFDPNPYDNDYFHEQVSESYDEEALIEKLADKIFARVQSKIQAELPQLFTQMFNETMANKIVTFMEDNKTLDKLLTGVFDNVKNIGQEKVEKMVENSSDVYEVVSKFEALDKVPPQVAALVSKVQNTFAASTIKDELASRMEEVYVAVQDGETPSSEISEVEKLLAKNDKDLALVDKVQFVDVKAANNDWYYGPVMKGLGEGIFTGDSGKGTFRPADSMNKAEALKTFLEASGEGKTAVSGGEWYKGYVEKAKQLGLSIGNQSKWGDAVSREELATMMYELGDFGTSAYGGEFQDIKAGDKIAPIAATLKEEGIIEGQENGKVFNPAGKANRAEVATMVTRYLDATKDARLFNELDAVDLKDYGLEEYEGADPTGGFRDFSDIDEKFEKEDRPFSLLKVTLGIGGLRI